jgi:tetrapyrrole methylase family protein / MazG family protein
MTALDELKAIVARLRAPDGCPWDREQTHASIRAQLLEECYEVLEAIDASDDALLQEELGDVLLHLVFHAQLASERGAFTMEDVIRGISDKLVRRHPHVFGETRLDTSHEVLQQWDALKKMEKPERIGALAGIPPALPALMRAQETQKKAAKVGYDWKNTLGVLDKVREEWDELAAAQHGGHHESTSSKVADEFGDVLFSMVNLARHLKLDAEQSLRDATTKFTRRFETVERLATSRELTLATLDEVALDGLWQEAKTLCSRTES